MGRATSLISLLCLAEGCAGSIPVRVQTILQSGANIVTVSILSKTSAKKNVNSGHGYLNPVTLPGTFHIMCRWESILIDQEQPCTIYGSAEWDCRMRLTPRTFSSMLMSGLAGALFAFGTRLFPCVATGLLFAVTASVVRLPDLVLKRAADRRWDFSKDQRA